MTKRTLAFLALLFAFPAQESHAKALDGTLQPTSRLLEGRDASKPRVRKRGVIIGSHHHFRDEIQRMKAGLQHRGYEVIHAASDASSHLGELIRATRHGDQVLLSMQCHGGVPPVPEKKDITFWRQHYCQVQGYEFIRTADILDAVAQLRGKGAKVIVMDNSCTGGSTVMAIQETEPTVCAISSAGDAAPALRGDPPFGDALRHHENIVRTFEDLATWGMDRMFKSVGQRIHQRAYMSGCATDSMNLHQGYFDEYMTVSEWNLQGTDLMRRIWPERNYKRTEPLAPYMELSVRKQREFEQVFFEFLRDVHWPTRHAALSTSFRRHHRGIMARYRAHGVAYPDNRIRSFDDLIFEMRKAVSHLHQRRAELQQELEAYEDRLLASTDPDTDAELKAMAARIRPLQNQLWAVMTALNPIFNVFDEINCKALETPCRGLEI